MGRRRGGVSREEHSERRALLRVAYDGSGYYGWQRQHGLPTIQGCLEEATGAFFGLPTPVAGASRTDAGVHAADQLAALSFRHPIQCTGLIKVLNRSLPQAISVRSAVEVPLDFNPRFASRGKRYRYQLYRSPQRDPLLDRYAWRIPWALDWERLMEGAAFLIGTHDFESFAASDGQHQSSIRRLWSVELRREATHGPHSVERWSLSFTGDAFLKQMIRNLVGTLVEVGRGHWEAEQIPVILKARARSAAGPTAPARGLTLEQSFWPEAPNPPRLSTLKADAVEG